VQQHVGSQKDQCSDTSHRIVIRRVVWLTGILHYRYLLLVTCNLYLYDTYDPIVGWRTGNPRCTPAHWHAIPWPETGIPNLEPTTTLLLPTPRKEYTLRELPVEYLTLRCHGGGIEKVLRTYVFLWLHISMDNVGTVHLVMTW
jgi:hypothetical protein